MDKIELAKYVKKLQSGDISAFEIIYNETNNQVYNTLFSFTKNEETSLDLMQETYLTVNGKIGSLKDPYAINSWINRIAINKAKRFFEKNKKEILLPEEGQGLFETQLEEDEEFLPQEILDNKEKQKIIKDIIDNLPIEQKTAVYLYYFDELSLSEVAEYMKCSEGTVKSRLNYARKKIKVEVDRWEKDGTKLYGTGVPVLLLLLKNQLEINNISLDKSNALLKDMLSCIRGSNTRNTVSEIANNNNKVASTIDGATKETGKVLSIKVAVIGIIMAVTVASLVFINKPSENSNSSESNVYSGSTNSSEINESNEIKKDNDFISYSSLNMDNGISTIEILGDDVVTTTDCPQDRCIEIAKKTSAEDGQAEVKVIDLNGNEKSIHVDVTRAELSTDYASSNEDFEAYKNYTDGTIVEIGDYDKNIVQINNNPEKKI